jgi:hypothetical protein
MPMEIKEV